MVESTIGMIKMTVLSPLPSSYDLFSSFHFSLSSLFSLLITVSSTLLHSPTVLLHLVSFISSNFSLLPFLMIFTFHPKPLPHPCPTHCLGSPLGGALLAVIGGIYIDRAMSEISTLSSYGIALRQSGINFFYNRKSLFI